MPPGKCIFYSHISISTRRDKFSKREVKTFKFNASRMTPPFCLHLLPTRICATLIRTLHHLWHQLRTYSFQASDTENCPCCLERASLLHDARLNLTPNEKVFERQLRGEYAVASGACHGCVMFPPFFYKEQDSGNHSYSIDFGTTTIDYCVDTLCYMQTVITRHIFAFVPSTSITQPRLDLSGISRSAKVKSKSIKP